MILSMSYQTQLFIYMVLLGIIIGMFYDFIRLFRRIVIHGIIAIQTEDFLYWLLSAFFVFFAVLRKNYGAIRPFLILGLFLGLIIYFFLISSLVLRVLIYIYGIIKKTVTFILRILYVVFYPFRVFFRFCNIPVTYIKNKLKKFYKNYKIYLKKLRKYEKIYLVFLNRCIRIIFRKH